MRKLAEFIKKHKIITILLAVAILLLAKSLFFKDEAAGYLQETAEKRDIVTYNSFVGNVEPASDIQLVAQASEEVVSLAVKNGDKVKAGDVIAELDTTAIDYNIKLQEANLETAKRNNKFNISDAKHGYESYKESIDRGLNTSIESARTQMNSAKDALQDAKDEYEDAKKSLENGSYEGIQSIYLQREQAYRAYLSASQASSDAYRTYSSKYKEYTEAKKAYDDAVNSSAENIAILKTAMDSAKMAMDSAKTQADAADRSYENARDTYNDTDTAYKNSKKSILKKLESAVDTAQTGYDTAKKNFEIAEFQVNQQLESYEAAYDKTKALSDVSAAEIQLNQLKATRADYIIKAPCDGTVTQLSLEKGEMATMGMPVATISNLDGMQVNIKVDEYTIKNVHVSSPVKILIDAIDKEYEGTLVEVDKTATVEGGGSYFNAKVSFTPDELVKAGMSVEVKLTRTDERNVLSVSQVSLQYNEDNTAYVLVKDAGGSMEQRQLVLGASDGIYVEVKDGLSEGEEIFYPKKFDFNMEEMDSMREARNSMMLGE